MSYDCVDDTPATRKAKRGAMGLPRPGSAKCGIVCVLREKETASHSPLFGNEESLG